MAAYWAPVLPAIFLPFLGSLLYFVILPGSSAARLAYGGVKLFTVAWPLLWLRFGARFSAPPSRRSVQDGNHSIVIGLLSGLFLAAFFAAAYHFGLDELLRPHVPAIRAKAEALGVLERYLPFAFFLALGHSLIEEFYWRYFLFGRLERILPAPAAFALAAFAFALHHYVILWQFFGPALALGLGTAVGLGGAFWCWLFARTRSLLGPWLSHALADAAIMALGYDLLFR